MPKLSLVRLTTSFFVIDVGPAFQVADAASTEREIEPSPPAITKAVDGRTYHRVLAESKSRSPATQRNANAKKIHISGSVETLSQTGVASINLTADQTEPVLSDGSSIDGEAASKRDTSLKTYGLQGWAEKQRGETTYTKTSGGTGTAATVTFADDANGYLVPQTVTHNADGPTTVDNKALNADGSLANEMVSTTPASGLSKTITFDWNGDGVTDQVQSDMTVVMAKHALTRANHSSQ